MLPVENRNIISIQTFENKSAVKLDHFKGKSKMRIAFIGKEDNEKYFIASSAFKEGVEAPKLGILDRYFKVILHVRNGEQEGYVTVNKKSLSKRLEITIAKINEAMKKGPDAVTQLVNDTVNPEKMEHKHATLRQPEPYDNKKILKLKVPRKVGRQRNYEQKIKEQKKLSGASSAEVENASERLELEQKQQNAAEVPEAILDERQEIQDEETTTTEIELPLHPQESAKKPQILEKMEHKHATLRQPEPYDNKKILKLEVPRKVGRQRNYEQKIKEQKKLSRASLAEVENASEKLELEQKQQNAAEVPEAILDERQAIQDEETSTEIELPLPLQVSPHYINQNPPASSEVKISEGVENLLKEEKVIEEKLEQQELELEKNEKGSDLDLKVLDEKTNFTDEELDKLTEEEINTREERIALKERTNVSNENDDIHFSREVNPNEAQVIKEKLQVIKAKSSKPSKSSELSSSELSAPESSAENIAVKKIRQEATNEKLVIALEELIKAAKNHGLTQSLALWRTRAGLNPMVSEDNEELNTLRNRLEEEEYPLSTASTILDLVEKGLLQNNKAVKSDPNTNYVTVRPEFKELAVAYEKVRNIYIGMYDKNENMKLALKKLIEEGTIIGLRNTLGQVLLNQSKDNKIIDAFLKKPIVYEKDPVSVASKTLNIIEKGFEQLQLADWVDPRHPEKGVNFRNPSDELAEIYKNTVDAFKILKKASNRVTASKKRMLEFEKRLDKLGQGTAEEVMKMEKEFNVLSQNPWIDEQTLESAELKFDYIKTEIAKRMAVKSLENLIDINMNVDPTKVTTITNAKLTNYNLVLGLQELVKEAKKQGLTQSLALWRTRAGFDPMISEDNKNLNALMESLEIEEHPLDIASEILELVEKGLLQNNKSVKSSPNANYVTVRPEFKDLAVAYEKVINIYNQMCKKTENMEVSLTKLIEEAIKQDLRETLGQHLGRWSSDNKMLDKFLDKSPEYKKNPTEIAGKVLKLVEQGLVQLNLAQWVDPKHPEKGIELLKQPYEFIKLYKDAVLALKTLTEASDISANIQLKLNAFNQKIAQFGASSLNKFKELEDEMNILSKKSGIDQKELSKAKMNLQELRTKVEETERKTNDLEQKLEKYQREHLDPPLDLGKKLEKNQTEHRDPTFLEKRKALTKIQNDLEALYNDAGYDQTKLQEIQNKLKSEENILFIRKEREEKPTQKNVKIAFKELFEEARKHGLTESLGYVTSFYTSPEFSSENTEIKKLLNELNTTHETEDGVTTTHEAEDLPATDKTFEVASRLKTLVEKGLVQAKKAHYESDKKTIRFDTPFSLLEIAYEKVLKLYKIMEKGTEINLLTKKFEEYKKNHVNSRSLIQKKALKELKNSLNSLRDKGNKESELYLLEQEFITEKNKIKSNKTNEKKPSQANLDAALKDIVLEIKSVYKNSSINYYFKKFQEQLSKKTLSELSSSGESLNYLKNELVKIKEASLNQENNSITFKNSTIKYAYDMALNLHEDLLNLHEDLLLKEDMKSLTNQMENLKLKIEQNNKNVSKKQNSLSENNQAGSFFIKHDKNLNQILASIKSLRKNPKHNPPTLDKIEKDLKNIHNDLNAIKYKERIPNNKNLIKTINDFIFEVQNQRVIIPEKKSKERKELDSLMANLSQSQNLLPAVSKILILIEKEMSNVNLILIKKEKISAKLKQVENSGFIKTNDLSYLKDIYETSLKLIDGIKGINHHLEQALKTFVSEANKKGLNSKGMWGDTKETIALNEDLAIKLIDANYPKDIVLRIFENINKSLVKNKLANWADKNKDKVVFIKGNEDLGKLYINAESAYEELLNVLTTE